MEEKNRDKTSILLDPRLKRLIPRDISISDAIELALRKWLDVADLEAEAAQLQKRPKHEREHEMLDRILDSGGDEARAVRAMLHVLVRIARQEKGG